ncbi:MAG: two-component system, chemotaxis family, protein-glutamate methylesterase/glutaminase [Gammaproteobacteria bacterium]|jgi:two-component system chemotaxis response regulator CheB|nr:two-component system, chemotaxis family, protein-glutamate methylesterase/glutaminase [Gammaproteobacteria bacterium]
MSTQSGRRLRVLIVDDSALVRRILTELLSADPEIEVVGAASDAYMARDKIKQLSPDVLTLDVEMPKMDGVTFLRNLMRLRPMPVVMVSSLTEHGAEITLDALAVGAVDYLPKPKIDLAATLGDYAEELCAKIKAAAAARVRRYNSAESSPGVAQIPPKYSADAVLPKAAAARQFRTTDRIIAIGASTGGTEAIREVLVQLPADTPGIVIAQHIPKAFSTPFAKRMNACCQMTVYEAENGQQILPGHVYIAPGDRHLLLVRDGARYVCKLDDGQPVNRHKPSVDVLFRSVAQQAGRNAIGVILTGMGKDGAAGLKEMRDAGSPTIAQDEATSVVWGMPREAAALGAAVQVLGLHEIPARLRALAESMDVTRASAAV